MFSLCGRMKKKRKCSWRNARERTTMDETCGTPDDQLILGHKDACTSRLVLNLRASQARGDIRPLLQTVLLSVKKHSEPPLIECLPIRQEILNVDQSSQDSSNSKNCQCK